MTKSRPKTAPRVVSSLLLVLSGDWGLAQSAAAPPPPTVSFAFERKGMAVPKFTLSVEEGGNATYQFDEVPAVRGTAEGDPLPRQGSLVRFTLTEETAGRIFATARALDRFNFPCASNAKNIADTGTKTLEYSPSSEGRPGKCTYNYAQDKRVVLVTETFQAIAATLDLGRKLVFDHRFDRLGLDADMARLVQEADAGRAIELGTIAPTLRSIADDADLLERVRSRAAKLLQQSQAQSQSQEPSRRLPPS